MRLDQIEPGSFRNTWDRVQQMRLTPAELPQRPWRVFRERFMLWVSNFGFDQR